MNNYLESFKGILKQIQEEVKKLYSKQEELNRREKDIFTIKDNITQILKLLRKQEPSNIEIKNQSFNKTKELKEKQPPKEKQEPKEKQPPKEKQEPKERQPPKEKQEPKEKQPPKEKQELKEKQPPKEKQESSNSKSKIQSLNKTKEIEYKSRVTSIVELKVSRIVTGNYNGYITLFSVNYEKEQWTPIKEHKGHNDRINCLCKFSQNRLISCSVDSTIKVWDINNDTITHVNTLEGHTKNVCNVISITRTTIASGSDDHTIKIWNVNAGIEILSLNESSFVSSLLKLKDKDVMVTIGGKEKISFWNTKTFQKERSILCFPCYSLNVFIELPNHNIAVSSGLLINIIDPITYKRIKQIECQDYLDPYTNRMCSLHLLNNETFIYSHGGSFCQISSTTYEVIFEVNMENEFRGDFITSSINGKYIIAGNENNNMSIFRVKY